MMRASGSKKKPSYAAILVVAVLGPFAACGDDGGARDDGGGPHPDAGGNLDNTPVMERTVAGTYTCAVTRDRTSLAPRTWTGRSALLPLADGSISLSRVEWETSTSGILGPTARSLLTSRFGIDGALSAPTTIPVDDPELIFALASAPRGDGFALVWADEQALHFAAFDASSTLVLGPKSIASPAIDSQIQLYMAADRAGDGFALALTERNEQKLEPRALFLDRDGNARGPLRPLATTAASATMYQFPAPYVAPATNGYVFIWNDPAGKSGRILFMKTDTKSGTEVIAPHAISFTDDAAVAVGVGGFGFERPGPRIVEMGNAFVAAWSEGRQGRAPAGDFSPTEGGGAVVRLTRLDSEGNPTGSALLRAHEDDVDEVEPVLTPLGDALAVSWSRGTHIYICGGCVPDHRIDLVVIDANSFDPLSQLVTVTNGGGRGAGGLLRKQTAVAASSLLMLYDVTFHTSTTPGSLAYTCTP